MLLSDNRASAVNNSTSSNSSRSGGCGGGGSSTHLSPYKFAGDMNSLSSSNNSSYARLRKPITGQNGGSAASTSLSISNSPTSSASLSSSSPNAASNSNKSSQLNTAASALSDRLLVKQAKLQSNPAINVNNRAALSYTYSSRDFMAAPEEKVTEKVTRRPVINYQTLNPNRLSHYDNFVLAEASTHSIKMNQEYDDDEDGTSDSQSSDYNNPETLPNYILSNGKYGRKRNRVPSNLVPNVMTRRRSPELVHTNSSSSSSSVPPKPNMLTRAFNYAFKKSSNGSSQPMGAPQAPPIKAPPPGSLGRSWRSKLGKYLTQGTNSLKSSSKLNHDQDGCDIIIDEDMFSSYHLSRKKPMIMATDSSLILKDTSRSNLILTSESLYTAPTKTQEYKKSLNESLNRLSVSKAPFPFSQDTMSSRIASREMHRGVNELSSSSTIIGKSPVKPRSESINLDWSKPNTGSSKRKVVLKKQKSFSSGSSTTTTQTNSSSSQQSSRDETTSHTLRCGESTAYDATASVLNNRSCHSSSRNVTNPPCSSITHRVSPTSRSYQSLSYKQEKKTQHIKNLGRSESINKPKSSINLNEVIESSTIKRQNSQKNSKIMGMLKVYKSMLSKIQKPQTDSSKYSNRTTSLSSSCLNNLNTRSLLAGQFSCVKSGGNQTYRESQVESSSSIFSYECRNHFDNDDDDKPVKSVEHTGFGPVDTFSQSSLNKKNSFMNQSLTLGSKKTKSQDKSSLKGGLAKSEQSFQVLESSSIADKKFKVIEPTKPSSRAEENNEDSLCDLEVASFFTNNKKFKTSIIQLDGNNFCYCYQEESSIDEKMDMKPPSQEFANELSLVNKQIASLEKEYSDEDEGSTQNLEYLVKQLVAEASLSDLNDMTHLKTSNKIYKPVCTKQQTTMMVPTGGIQKRAKEIYENNGDTCSLDLEQSEFVDDQEDIYNKNDYLDDDDDEFVLSEDNEELNHEISLSNYGPNGFQPMNDKITMPEEQPIACVESEVDDDDSSDAEIACINNNKISSQMLGGVCHLHDTTPTNRRSNSASYSASLSGGMSPSMQKRVGLPVKSTNDNNSKLIMYTPTDKSSNKSSLDQNSIKIEKKIRLNYRKPQTGGEVFNFGTLC